MVRRLRWFYLAMAAVAAMGLVFAPFAVAHGQTPRATQIRTIVRDQACPPATGWIARDTTYATSTQATTAARTKLVCPALPPVVDSAPSAATSTLALYTKNYSGPTDSVLVGDTIGLIVTVKTALGVVLGNGKTISVDAMPGVAVATWFFDATSSRYFVILTGTAAAPTTALRVRVNGVLLSASVPLRVVALVTTPPVVVPPVVTPPGPVTQWTFCSTTGAMCDFTGSRVVRLANADNSQFVTQVAYANIPCAGYGFTTPSNFAATHCDYGPIQYVPLTNPHPMNGQPAVWQVPVGSSGNSAQRLGTGAGQSGSTPGEASTRFTCQLATMAHVDPIVFPGDSTSSHLHMQFGNTGFSAYSTSATLLNSGNSTCLGGTLNRTAYWVPALYDTKDGHIIVPEAAFVYYKSGYLVDPTKTQPMPNGLHIIAGNKNSTTWQYVDPTYVLFWECEQTALGLSGTIPQCATGDVMRLVVGFPQCWDGVNLDSPDHQSHMAYASRAGVCPSTHPVQVPTISEIFRWKVQPGDNPSSWRLTSDMYSASMPGGLSAHADWMTGWDPATMQALITNCFRTQLDCGVGGIGGGRSLY